MRKNNIVEIEFRDHARGDETLVFKVFGRVLRVTRVEVTVGVWTYSDPRERFRPDDPNVDKYTIARDAILNYRILASK